MITERLEFHRNAAALMPAAKDRRPGVAFMVNGPVKQSFCSCTQKKGVTCPHLKQLYQAVRNSGNGRRSATPADRLKNSIWLRLAEALAQRPVIEPRALHIQFHEARGRKALLIKTANQASLLSYFSDGSDQYRLADRLGAFSSADDQVPDRATVLARLRRMTLSDTERLLNERGLKSRRQAFEDSFWYGFAYHCFREFTAENCAFAPSVNQENGDFILSCRRQSGETLFHLTVPRLRVRHLLETFGKVLPNQHQLPIHPIPLKTIFKISPKTDLDLDVRPQVKLIQQEGEACFFEREELERFRYGDLVYIKTLGILAALENPEKKRRFAAPRRITIKKHQIPAFLSDVGESLLTDQFQVDPAVKHLKLLRRLDRVAYSAEAIDRDWCYLSIHYGVGRSTISLAELLRARKEGQRYVGTPDGWVDCQAAQIDRLASAAESELGRQLFQDPSHWRLSRQALFKISALSPRQSRIDGPTENADHLERLLALQPSSPPPTPRMTSRLRRYQIAGLHWLWWLYENGLGGLLCDEMGLGKTHQVMALMLCIRAAHRSGRPFLVVCPTTVLSHWVQKINQYAPRLSVDAHHGSHRDVEAALAHNDVLVTSYGILLRDIARLKQIDFALVVFDEIQYLKNNTAKTHLAAAEIRAGLKLGLTGTPLENTLMELRNLMQLVLPGYLGTEADFGGRYEDTENSGGRIHHKDELQRLIFPFTLRRLKQSVLTELPPKIDDIRCCTLSDDQIKLYRDAIENRGAGIVRRLEDSTAPVPYIHIFALLTLLKQICNHPAAVKKAPLGYEGYTSGKWDLFKELLQESLEAGQKVVVYSQFVLMIRIIEAYLTSRGIGFATLTGQSRNRGRLVERFNTDPACRVFVGSLKAGGTGIDLVAASVVIHYDRWWNAAKEDQATDRVHRIGQRRGVQVFKLVTLGTLEEKISAIIDKKKKLMDNVVREDDPGVLKCFTRQELLDMIRI